MRLYAPLDGRKEYTGTLEAYDEAGLTLKLEKGAQIEITRREAALVRPHLRF